MMQRHKQTRPMAELHDGAGGVWPDMEALTGQAAGVEMQCSRRRCTRVFGGHGQFLMVVKLAFERASREDAPTPFNLDFDARVPIPFSVFPSSYRSDASKAEHTEIKVESKLHLPDQSSRVGREGHASEAAYSVPVHKDKRVKEEVRFYERDRHRPTVHEEEEEEVRIYERDYDRRHPRTERDRFEPYRRYEKAQINVPDRTQFKERVYDSKFDTVHGPATTYADSQIDSNERQFREYTRPIVDDSRYEFRHQSTHGSRAEEVNERRHPHQDQVRVESSSRTTVDPPKHKRDMGYYDDEGHYHSFRHGLHKAADRILHPIHGHSHTSHHKHEHHHDRPVTDREEVIIKETHAAPSKPRSSVSVSHSHRQTPRTSAMASSNSITIPCHHIRIGDLLILQGRPCQVIRITTSSQTGQHRYLGVDLFTKQLHEESSFISNPAPSVIVQNMLGPVFKQYRVLDIREDGRVVCMTEGGDVKQGLPVNDQDHLLKRLTEAFDDGRGSIRVLVISDSGTELIVDYKVVHGSRL
ncbi:putative Woronin body protein hexa [Phyllosticta citriasiana]|uniref:Woronin body protein hexa n=1 Tax=Phyllosticta citriasiana TaxID=595635 RepID=A0ABR1KJF9_9PEZI